MELTCRVRVSSLGSTWPTASYTLAQWRSLSARLRSAAMTGIRFLYSSTTARSPGTSLLGVRPRSILNTALWNLHNTRRYTASAGDVAGFRCFRPCQCRGAACVLHETSLAVSGCHNAATLSWLAPCCACAWHLLVLRHVHGIFWYSPHSIQTQHRYAA